MTRHKHADIIHAWADGAEVGVYDIVESEGVCVARPSWGPDIVYRLKSKKRTIKYRNYITQDGRMGVVEEGVRPTKDCVWVGDWQEVEVKV